MLDHVGEAERRRLLDHARRRNGGDLRRRRGCDGGHRRAVRNVGIGAEDPGACAEREPIAAGVELSTGIEVQGERAGSTFITGASSQTIPIERTTTGYFGEGRWNSGDRLFVTAGLRVEVEGWLSIKVYAGEEGLDGGARD